MSTSTERPHTPTIGDVVKDSRTRKLGEVMGAEGPYYPLRPLGGGREWDVAPEDIRKADPEEVLSARVDLENRRSRGELPLGLEPARFGRVKP